MMARAGSVAVAGVEASRLRGSPREWGRIRLSHSSAALRNGLSKHRASGAFSREILAEDFLVRNSVHHNNENAQKISVKAPRGAWSL